ncbi:MAG: hypothetical protein WB555_01065 [Candidatus Korobacteraceae bacterium]
MDDVVLRPSGPVKTILVAGLIAGFLDGMDAVVYIAWMSGRSAVRVFQFIASGALGMKSFDGGVGTALLGVFFHFVIAIGAAAVFYVLSVNLPMVLRRPLLWGPAYGVGVFVFMHYVVVPLSAAPKQPPLSLPALANLLLSHIFFVGIPIAWVTRQFSRSS